MSWFERQRANRDPQQIFNQLAEGVRAVKATQLVDKACGKIGLRRFILRFERKGAKLRIVEVQTERLKNGGPPDASCFDAHAGALEKMLGDLQQRMPAGYRFDRGALLVLRDETGPPRLSFRFDEDADQVGLSALRLPRGTGSPVEELEYLKALESWSNRIGKLRANWVSAGGDDRWSLESGRLKLVSPGSLERSWRAEAIATWVPHTGDFTWLLAEPAGDEAPFLHPTLILELGVALELVAFAATRLNGTGVFQGSLLQPPGVQAFVLLKG